MDVLNFTVLVQEVVTQSHVTYMILHKVRSNRDSFDILHLRDLFFSQPRDSRVASIFPRKDRNEEGGKNIEATLLAAWPRQCYYNLAAVKIIVYTC